MKVLVFGSFNIDHVYAMPHLPARGETLYCAGYEVHVGGKGLNQALALQKAGAQTVAAGKVGPDGAYLTDYLKAGGVDVSAVAVSDVPTGHTIIECDPDGQNQMILFGGANRAITEADCDAVLAAHGDAALLLTEYETSCVEPMLRKAKASGIRTAFNPSPFVEALRDFPYELVDCIVLNQSEGESITGERDPEAAARALHARNHGEVILTLGADGALYYDGTELVRAPAFRVNAVDTTGAGDTFTGYCLHALLCGADPRDALRIGQAAAAIEVTRPGAAETIPDRPQVEAFLQAQGNAI
ncbi:MAG: ribokinase [Clostridia bacterium]|nr:ribokinase [Clostridia bacterium]